MLKDDFKSAMNKVKASDDFMAKLDTAINQPGRQKKFTIMRLVPTAAVLCVLLYTGISVFPSIQNQLKSIVLSVSNPSKFEIIEENSNISGSYITVLYMDGYAYQPFEWISDVLTISGENDYPSMMGRKLGEVTLDLKGKKYRGIPPDFSSTYEVGTEIYEIINVKRESAVLVKDSDYYSVFFRSSKLVSSKNAPLDLNMSQIFNMLSKSPQIVSIELRSEENFAWMNTSEDSALISLINKELSDTKLLNLGQFTKKNSGSSQRVTIDLIFADGMPLRMQVYPGKLCAYTFGGYIPISEELAAAIQALSDQGSAFPCLIDMIPYDEEEVSYLYFKNHVNGDEVLCEKPAWSRSPFFDILGYYYVEKTAAGSGQLVMTGKIGKTEEDSITINFYAIENKHILTEIGGVFYKPVRKQLKFKCLESYLEDYTDLGFR